MDNLIQVWYTLRLNVSPLLYSTAKNKISNIHYIKIIHKIAMHVTLPWDPCVQYCCGDSGWHSLRSVGYNEMHLPHCRTLEPQYLQTVHHLSPWIKNKHSLVTDRGESL